MTFTEQLLQELADAGGRIVKTTTGRDSMNRPSRIAAARRSIKLPKTKELHGGWCRDGYEIMLVDTPAWRFAVLAPVPGPSRLTRPHSVEALLDQNPPLRPHPVRTPPLGPERRPAAPGERMGRHPRPPLEEQLAEITQEVTLRGEAAERQEELEAARQKRLRWQAAMEKARVQYAETYRVRHFEAQEAAWRHATRLTEYVTAARTRIETMPPGRTRTEAEAWINWAEATAERLDPLNTPLRMPIIPEPQANDLKPFLGHWNPYGP
ncbi:nucleolar 14 family protein [Streptomyces sp. M3]|uniref:nucleolar 14 family protein n=1 Tax=Streptomyces sp. M3 TaxID=295102 RepID=UPI001F50A51C|nr:nucleolar 14 family protein [Streptomyces sp. M3]